ncbi:hypothetical protein C9374_013958 [Naegleria lovaniensis]|uniref:PAS domain-containing protein n=1 Tax=Naegleria lovaniensis TaxID=51637 RepID=A0AA88H1P7_NAELO|nr:uncharacterized protein C9374_013958 [Naegleria lovaniensis]KAG2389398.1 hypothetical protein C9374_013958 [Naegleria lovaniensis]
MVLESLHGGVLFDEENSGNLGKDRSRSNTVLTNAPEHHATVSDDKLKAELSRRQRGVYLISLSLGLILACIIMCISIPVTVVVVKSIEDTRLLNVRAGVTQIGITAFLTIKRQIELSMSSLISIAQVVYAWNYNVTDSGFNEMGSRLSELYPELAQFELEYGLRLSYVYPYNPSIIGKIVGSEPEHYNAIQRAIADESITIFGPVWIKRLASASLITQFPIFFPNGTFWGLSSSLISFDTLFKRIGLYNILSGYEYQLYDNAQQRIFLESRFGTNQTVNGITNNLTMITDPVIVNQTVLNSEYQLFLKPLKGWQLDDIFWVELTFAIVLNIILFLVVILGVFQIVQDYFRKREYQVIQNKLEIKVSERTRDLAHSHNQLSLLLDKISLEEQRTRKILNTIDDAVVTITSEGLVIHYNNSFLNMFSLKEIDIRKAERTTTTINTLLPKMNTKEIFEKHNEDDSITNFETIGVSKAGIEFNIRISVNFCKMLKSEVVKGSSIVTSNEQERVAVLLIHSNADRSVLLKNLKEKEKQYNLLIEKMEFKEMFDNHERRNQFKEFCAKEHNDESILFLEDVQLYKSLVNNLQQRSELQHEIYNKYLSTSAPKQLNISSEELETYGFKVKSGIGQIDLFDGLEKVIINNIIFDSFKRWTMQQPKDNASSTTESLTSDQKISLARINGM